MTNTTIDILLYSNERVKGILWKDSRFADCEFFHVNDGPSQFAGMRIRNAYIDRYCCDFEQYQSCLDRIQHSIQMTSREGRMILI